MNRRLVPDQPANWQGRCRRRRKYFLTSNQSAGARPLSGKGLVHPCRMVLPMHFASQKKQESQGFRRRRADTMVKEEQTSVSPPRGLSEMLPVECKATQCIFCLGNESLTAGDRLKAFAARGTKCGQRINDCYSPLTLLFS